MLLLIVISIIYSSSSSRPNFYFQHIHKFQQQQQMNRAIERIKEAGRPIAYHNGLHYSSNSNDYVKSIIIIFHYPKTKLTIDHNNKAPA